MKKYKIATIAGDGIGKEVVPESLKVLKEAAKKHQFQIQFDEFDFASCDYYQQNGRMLPVNWKEQIEKHDAIYFGRIEASKGVDKLCAAWDKICTKGKLHIVGDGTLLEALKKDYGQKNIIFYGSKTHQEIEKVIQLCAFYISLSPREGKSLSLQEALSTGLIPIVTNIPSQSYLTSELGLRLIEANLDNCEDVLSFYNESSIKVRSALGKIVKEYNKQKPCSHWKASWIKTLNL